MTAPDRPLARFARDFVCARQAFLDAATAEGADVQSYAHPLAGPGGEPLSTDVARLGPTEAGRMLVVVSATHGIEGFAGSACQFRVFHRGLELPPDTGLLLVHAINPYGFAWQRRVNEDNVDLNRNFVSHDGPYPANPIYQELADALCPRTWDEATLAETERAMESARARYGAREVTEAVSRGQYSHPDGLFFGGHAPTWSNLLLRRLARRHLASARVVAMIDVHTGLGPRGYGEPIATTTDPGALATLRDWYGDEVKVPGGGSVSGTVTGVLSDGIAGEIGADLLPIVLEFGTVAREEVRLALRAENWLQHFGDPSSPQGREIKDRIRSAFYPDSDEWKGSVLGRFEEILGKTLAGLVRIHETAATKQAS